MVTALPAAILLMIYFFFVARPAGNELKELRRQVGVAQQRAPSMQEQSRVLSELRELEAEVRKKQDAARKRQEREEALLAFWNDPDAKARGGEFISNLLASNSVVLVEEAVADEKDKGKFEAILEALPSAELWRLRLAGSYDAMRKTIAAIGDTELPLIPAGVEMEPRVDGNRTIHLWNLWICR